jgi:hypothetical protein
MPNLHRGEIQADLGGRSYVLCLTLGALAELEAAFGAEDLLTLAARFESGRISARDTIRILGAGLRGGGNDLADDEVAALTADGGLTGHLDIVARLLVATFGGGEDAPANPPVPHERERLSPGAT